MVMIYVLISAPAYRLGYLGPRLGTQAAFVILWVHCVIVMFYNGGVYAVVVTWQPLMVQVGVTGLDRVFAARRSGCASDKGWCKVVGNDPGWTECFLREGLNVRLIKDGVRL